MLRDFRAAARYACEMRVVAILLGLGMLLAARPADACGEWTMTDHEKNRVVRYLINSASVTAGKRRVGAFYLDSESAQAKRDGMRTVQKRKVQFDIKGDKLRKYGRPIATVEGNTVTFGKTVYTIELTEPHEFHGMPAWKLAVKRDGEVIVEAADASSLCAGLERTMTAAQSEDEVRRRVTFYLAWREVGGKNGS